MYPEYSIKRLLLFICLFSATSFGTSVFSQEYSYVHYDVKDGLAGSTVYCMVQDKDGFMWFGTETGLSRFDGTHFKNFYTSDGLPDNEIIRLFTDSKKRVWIVPFRISLAYYQNGRIHNQQNDSLLKKINLTSEVVSIVENNAGDVLIQEVYGWHLIQASGKLIEKTYNKDTIWFLKTGLNKKNGFRFGIIIKDKGFCFADLDQYERYMKLKNDSAGANYHGTIYISPKVETFRATKDSLRLIYAKDSSRQNILLPKGFMSFTEINDSIIAFNSLSGVFLFNVNQRRITTSFFQNQTVNAIAEDMEDNFWFSIFGKGVYRLGSTNIVNYSFKTYRDNSAVYAIKKIDSGIYVGTDNFFLWKIDAKGGKKIYRKVNAGFSTQGRVTCIFKGGGDSLLLGTDQGLSLLANRKIESVLPIAPYKGTAIKTITGNNGILTISTNLLAFRIRLKDLSLLEDRIWNTRATCACEKNDTFYIGMLDGLYAVDKKANIIFLGNKFNLFRSRIMAIAEHPDGSLWIATSGNGLIRYKNGRITAHITMNEGLTSDICRNILVAAGHIWAGTDRGLNKIIPVDTGFQVTNYTTADGLKSDMINTIEVEGKKIWVGTPEGLTYFDEDEMSKKSDCRLVITNINISSNKLLFDTAGFRLAHKDNNIQFDFVGISYKSGGDIIYNYKLSGLDTSWKTTRETFLSYPSLPSGEYQLQLFAVNKFGVKSDQAQIRFVVEKLLWQKLWFQALVLLFAISLAWLIAYLRIRKLKMNAEQKMILTKKVAELEQMALKSQMNPHFIFNSLNSIQQYVIDKDILGANEFITQFSRLIRLTLDISSKLSISLDEELIYISTYLELEKKRFENKFMYQIVVGVNVDTLDFFIPPMILQPYIENAIRHGMRYRNDNDGRILISISKNEEYLICSIEDNGIGRKRAMQLKSSVPIEYQSKGMTLTAKRIEIFNTMHPESILVDINDLENDRQEPSGTRITIYFPLQGTINK